MPLLDSFTVDHTIMPAPAVRKAKTMKTPCGDKITVYDLRFYKPNEDKMDGREYIRLSIFLPVLCVII